MTFTGDIDAIVFLVVQREDTGETLELPGREAWCAAHLIEAGEAGVTSLERPAPRWSEYIRKLRRRGLTIETRNEMHAGPYSGRHGRYFSLTPLRIERQEYAQRGVA